MWRALIGVVLVVGCTQSPLGSKKSLTYPLMAEPKSLDPILATDPESILVLKQIQVGLTRQDSIGNLLPALAERWESLEGGKKIRFHIRPAQWSDEVPVRAQDFVFGWMRTLDPKLKSTWGQRLSCVEGAEAYADGTGPAEAVGIRAISEKVFEVDVRPGTCDLPRLASYTGFVPQREDLLKANPADHSSPKKLRVTGPFQVRTWEQGSRVVLTVNAHYFGTRPQLDQVELRMGLNTGALYTLYEHGALDVLYPVPLSDMPRVLKNPDRMVFMVEGINPAEPMVKNLQTTKVQLLAKPRVQPFPLGVTGIPSFDAVEVAGAEGENEG